MADQWKIGRKTVGDGVLLVVAKNDRRLRIEVAKALEGAIPDLAASQIMDRYITPAFKAGDFAGGISLGVDALAARIAGETCPRLIKRHLVRGAAMATGRTWVSSCSWACPCWVPC